MCMIHHGQVPYYYVEKEKPEFMSAPLMWREFVYPSIVKLEGYGLGYGSGGK